MGSRMLRARRFLGAPMIERELLGWRRWLAVSGLVTGLVVVGNVGYYLYLASMRVRADSYWLSNSELRFLDSGLDGIAAHTQWSLLPLVMLVLFVMAPGLACLSVMREAQTRTLDSLIASPLPAHGLHNGFVLGALARLAPWVAPALVIHVAFGLTGLIDPATMVSTTLALAAGSWGMTSLGAMLGGLYKGRAQSSLMSLGAFGGAALVTGLPILALETRGEQRVFAALSPAAAVLHSLVTDANAILSHGFSDLSPVYDGRLLGLPLSPIALAVALMVGLGLLTTHAGARRFRDPLAPLLDHRVAIAGMVGVAGFAMVFAALNLPGSDWGMNGFRSQQWRFGEHLVGHGFILNVVCLPFVVLFAAASSQSSAFLARSGLWNATRPEDIGARRADLSASAQFGALAAIPLLAAFAMPFLTTDLPIPVADAELQHRIFAVLPWCWGLLGMLSVVALVQHTRGKAWQHGLALLGVCAFGAFSLVYTFVFIDEHRLSASDFAYDDGIHVVISFLLAAAFVAGPLVMFAVVAWRRRVGQEEFSARVEVVLRREELPDTPFVWPTQRQERDLLLSLRAPMGQVAGTEQWLSLDGQVLRAWSGSVKGQAGVEVDLSGPFTVTAAVQPDRDDEEHHSALWMLNITVAAGDQRISFALPAQPTVAVARLPRQDQRLPRVGPRDATALLGAIRFHAEAAGTALPL